MGGARAYQAGLAAEDQVARHYVRRGYGLAARRWRGKAGEIDLILRGDAGVVFVEVKHSARMHHAALMLRPRQIARLYAAAEEFLAQEPAGLLSETRFDVALCDGQGTVSVIENALGG